MRRIDSHQHFWRYSSEDYGWIKKGSPIEQSFEPKQLQPVLSDAGFDACIAVQARQNLIENDYLCRLAASHEFVVGVVGWIDLQSDHAAEQALKFSEQPKAVGVRHVVQDEADPNFMARPKFRDGIRTLHPLGLVYDILIYENQLDDAIALVKAFPNQSFVLDHVAKPKIAMGQIEPWATNIRRLSQFPNVVVKVSGMITEADHRHWNIDQLTHYWNVITDCFPPARLMFGSDWPVLNLASNYAQWVTIVSQWTESWSETEQANFFGGTASKIYGLGDKR